MKRAGASVGALILACAVFFAGCESAIDSDGRSIPLAGPRSIQITARDKELVAQWTKVAPAQGIDPTYRIYWATSAAPSSAEGSRQVLPDASKLVKTAVTGLTNHVTYYIWVKAFYEGLGESDYSPTVYAEPIPPPAKPERVTVYPGEEMLDIAWDAAADAFTYEVYYGTSAGAEPPSSAALQTVSEAGTVLSGLSNGTAYTIWVRSVNTAGESGFVRASGTARAAQAPPVTAPSAVTVTGGEGKLTVTWDQVREAGAAIPGYRVYYGQTNNPAGAAEWPEIIPACSPKTSADITGLDNDAPYYVWVKSWNSRGTSAAFSPAATGTPKAKPPIKYDDPQFALGTAGAEYIFAQDLPASVFFPEGRPNTDRLTRVQETALGNLFTDGAAWYIRNKLKEQVDFVFLNGGYIDNVLPKGAVTVGGLTGIVQPDSRRDTFFLLSLPGSQLKAFFEDAADVVHTGRGGPHNTGFFGLVSREVNYTIQYPKPPALSAGAIGDADAEPYYHGRIKPGTLKINGAEIDDNKMYRIGVTDYLASGEYFTRLYTDGVDKKPVSVPFWRGVAEYIYDRGTVTPYLDGRVKVEGGVPLPAPWVPGDYAP
jgi:hypothetical protein